MSEDMQYRNRCKLRSTGRLGDVLKNEIVVLPTTLFSVFKELPGQSQGKMQAPVFLFLTYPFLHSHPFMHCSVQNFGGFLLLSHVRGQAVPQSL